MEEASFLNEIIREADLDNQIQIEVEQEQESSSTAAGSTTTPLKRKRSQSGNPYLDAEIVALSPNALQATNRFICEVCNKGFQREQNLQLHRRGHNLPWKLKQKSTKEVVRKKVYLCPEPTCVHHDPSRALGDLTGIKKHYSRKHGEKKYKCEKCSKKYAVQSDWKAHLKTCGTREYRCDCGTIFSRRDSFVTHRAFCDVLAQESARMPIGLSSSSSFGLLANHKMSSTLSLSNSNSQFCSFQDQAPSFSQMTPSPSYAFYLPSAVTNARQQFQESMIKPYNFLVPNPNLHSSINGTQNDASFFLSSNQIHNNNNAIYSGNLMGDEYQYNTQIGVTSAGGYDRNNSESMNMGSMSYGMESNSKLKDLMYSFANGNMGICGVGYDTAGMTVNETYGSGTVRQDRLSIGGNETTRDFLGVGTSPQISTVEHELRSESSGTRPLISGGGGGGGCLMQSYGSN